MDKKIIIISSIVLVTGFFVFLTIYLINSRQIFRPEATGVPNCPSGTQYLFTPSTTLKVGQTTALGGRIDSMSGNPTMENRNGIPMVQYVPAIKVTFTKNILLDSALIFDNDPKSGEKPWSINGVSLPVTGGGNWGPLFKLNQATNVMNFANGGDSSHINVCVKDSESPTDTPTPQPSNTPTPEASSTPTPSRSPTPESTPTNTPTPTNSPTPTITPSPTTCPFPNAVTDVTVSCENCNQQ